MNNLAQMYIPKILKWLLFCIYWLLCFCNLDLLMTCINVSVDCVYIGYRYFIHIFYRYLYFYIVGNGISISLYTQTERLTIKLTLTLIHLNMSVPQHGPAHMYVLKLGGPVLPLVHIHCSPICYLPSWWSGMPGEVFCSTGPPCLHPWCTRQAAPVSRSDKRLCWVCV